MTTRRNNLGLNSRRPGFLYLTVRFIVFAALLVWLGNSSASAQTIIWTGATDANWSTTNNWNLGLAPVATNNVILGDTNATGGPGGFGPANNIVDTNFTISTLQYSTSTNGEFQTTEIPDGVTLTITGSKATLSAASSLLVGTDSAVGAGAILDYASIYGAGSLVVSNAAGSINVREGNNITYGWKSLLDMSGLNYFNATVRQFLVAGEGPVPNGINRGAGQVFLGLTNIITLTAPIGTPGISLGLDSGGGNQQNGDLELGYTNVILSDSGILVGGGKSVGTMEFYPGGYATPPVAVFRNSAGTGRQDYWGIGDNAAGNSSTTGSGTVDFTAGTVDAMVNTMIVGRGQNGTGGGYGIGTLKFSSGKIDVNTLTIGTCYTAGNRNGGNGTVLLSGTAQLVVNNDTLLGMVIGSTSATKPAGALIVTGGSSALIKGNIDDGATPLGTTVVGVDSSSLTLGGQMGRVASGQNGLENFNLTNANLTLTLSSAINSANPICRVTNLTLSSAVTINVQGGGFTLGQYPLINYLSGSIGGDGYGVVTLGSLPSRTLGYLSNNVANNSIDLVITAIGYAKWEGNLSGDWDINTTANWQDTATSLATKYLENNIPGDTTLFDDTATGTTTVNLTTDLSPASVTVSNISKTYTFQGPGGLSANAGAFIKNGSGTLVIGNSGTNAFSGTVSINGGTVQLATADNRLPIAAVVTLANTSGTLLDLNGRSQTIHSLSGGGATGGNVSLGSGTLTTTGNGTYGGVISGSGALVASGGSQVLGGANLHTGGTTVSGGTLTLDNSTGSGAGTGAITIGPPGLLVLGNNDAAGSVSPSQTVTDNGALYFNRSDNFTFPNLIAGAGSVRQVSTTSNIVTIATANTFAGGTEIDNSTLRITDPQALGSNAIYIANPGTFPTSLLQLDGGIDVTNLIQMDMKNGALGIVNCVESISGTNTLSGPMQVYSGGSAVRFASDVGSRMIISGPVTFFVTGSSRGFEVLGDGTGDLYSVVPDVTGNSFFKDGLSTWTLWGTNLYSGNTEFYNGTLNVNGAITSTNEMDVYSADCVLGGTGFIASPIVLYTGATLSPGVGGIGALTVSNSITMMTGSTNYMEIDKGHGTHDAVVGGSTFTFAGTLIVNNLSGALANNDMFKLYDATNYQGGFDAIIPATPGGGLAWNTNTLTTDGTLRVMTGSGPATNPTNILYSVIGTSTVQLSWPTDHTGWRLEVQTNNLGMGVSANPADWGTVAGSTSTNSVSITVSPGLPCEFYRLTYP